MLRFHPSSCKVVCFPRFETQFLFEKGPPYSVYSLAKLLVKILSVFLLVPTGVQTSPRVPGVTAKVLSGVTPRNCKCVRWTHFSDGSAMIKSLL